MKNKELQKLTGIDVLTASIASEEIEWRIASARNGKTHILPYITNRCVMDRFDEAFGWDGWMNEVQETSRGFICTIKVLIDMDGQPFWISKSDGASETKVEAFKGGISDSMKRCAVQYGLGRELYEYPKVYIEGEHKYIPNWVNQRLTDLVKWFNNKSEDEQRDVIVIKQSKQ